jgi:hypothetical protein
MTWCTFLVDKVKDDSGKADPTLPQDGAGPKLPGVCPVVPL